MHALLIILLALSFAPTPQPTAAWDARGRLIVSWPQDVSGERCISLEPHDGPPHDYGCFWFFGQVGYPVRTTLPSEPRPAPGDTIVVSGGRVVVGPRLVYLPLTTR